MPFLPRSAGSVVRSYRSVGWGGDDEGDAVAESFRFFDIVGGRKDRRFGPMEIGDRLTQLPHASHVHACRGPIQKLDCRLGDDTGGAEIVLVRGYAVGT